MNRQHQPVGRESESQVMNIPDDVMHVSDLPPGVPQVGNPPRKTFARFRACRHRQLEFRRQVFPNPGEQALDAHLPWIRKSLMMHDAHKP
ncbi:MAG: hypothetical protein ACTHLW_14740 [Verrucomicrobiota bacterium]